MKGLKTQITRRGRLCLFISLLLLRVDYFYCQTQLVNETIYFFPEQELYIPGDTLTITGIVWDNYSLSSISEYVNIEFISEQGEILVREKVKTINSFFSCSLPVDLSTPFGLYYVRAYTQYMRNNSPITYPMQAVYIGALATQPAISTTPHFITYYPEGGNLIENVVQQMVFEVKDIHNSSVSASGYLMSEYGDTILSNISTNKNGLGIIRFIPTNTHRYILEFPSEDVTTSFLLPLPNNKPTLSAVLKRDQIFIRFLFPDKTKKDEYSFSIWNRGENLYKVNMTELGEEVIIPCSEFSAGLITCIITDREEKIIAERVLFKQPQQPSIRINLRDSVFSAKQKIRLDVLSKDSIAVVYNHIIPFDRLSNKKSLFTSFYFDNDMINTIPHSLLCIDDETNNGNLDLILYTLKSNINFKCDILKIIHPQETALTIKGKVYKENKSILKEGYVVAFNNLTGSAYESDINNKGEFIVEIDDLYEETRFFLQGYDKKNRSNTIQIEIEDEQIPSIIHASSIINRPYKQGIISEIQVKIENDFNFTSFYLPNNEKVIQLPEVKVDAKAHKPHKPTKEFYRHTYIDSEIIERSVNMRAVLDRMTGIFVAELTPYDVDKEEGKPDFSDGIGKIYKIFSTRGSSTTKENKDKGFGELTVLVDGMKVDTRFIFEGLDISMIESVERLSPIETIAYTSGALDGAIHVRTKRYKEAAFIPKGTVYKLKGLTKTCNDEDYSKINNQHSSLEINIKEAPGDYFLIVEGITIKNEPFYSRIPIKIKD